MDDETSCEGLRDSITRQGEDALGKLAQDLLENPLVSSTLTRAFEARERAVQAQEAAMGALNLPSAADIERLTRRLRSVSQRLEGIEDGVDRLDQHVQDMSASHTLGERLDRIEQHLAALVAEVGELGGRLPAGAEPVARGQERLRVGDAGR